MVQPKADDTHELSIALVFAGARLILHKGNDSVGAIPYPTSHDPPQQYIQNVG